MKRLFLSLVLSLVSLVVFGQTYYEAWNLKSTNILMQVTGTTNTIRPGIMRLEGGGNGSRIQVNGYVFPGLILGYGANTSLIMMLTNGTPTLLLTTNVIIPGDLTVLGTVTGSGLVFSVTNFTTVTNAIIATNAPDLYPVVSTNMLAVSLADTNLFKATQAYYPTNLSGSDVDMTIPYSDVTWTPGFFFSLGASSLSTTNYQTAVRILHNYSGGTSNQITWTVSFDHVYGNPWITNETVCTFFYNPSVPESHILFLPLW